MILDIILHLSSEYDNMDTAVSRQLHFRHISSNKIEYAYVDVNGDENPELIFKISSNTSELMYIWGICDNELVCFDVFETHTRI